MLTIARTLMGNPRAILLDEPSEGLAPVIVEQMAATIEELKRDGLTVLLSEQNLHFASAIANRALIIEKGRIRYQGTLAELVANAEVPRGLSDRLARARHAWRGGKAMDSILPAYKVVGERRFRETSGLFWEDFRPGDVFEHRPGRTVLDTDNVWFTLLTMNTQQVHFDAAYAARTEWKALLVDLTFTLALLTGMSVRTVSAKVVANLGWDKVKASHPVFAGDTLYAESTVLSKRESRAARPRASSPSRPAASTRTASRS